MGKCEVEHRWDHNELMQNSFDNTREATSCEPFEEIIGNRLSIDARFENCSEREDDSDASTQSDSNISVKCEHEVMGDSVHATRKIIFEPCEKKPAPHAIFENSPKRENVSVVSSINIESKFLSPKVRVERISQFCEMCSKKLTDEEITRTKCIVTECNNEMLSKEDLLLCRKCKDNFGGDCKKKANEGISILPTNDAHKPVAFSVHGDNKNISGKKFQCNCCEKGFTTKTNLKRHMQRHLGLKPFACERCKERFYLISHLKSHMKVHTGNKPYKCDICPKAYVSNAQLEAHLNSHAGVKPYICDCCGKGYSQKGTLKEHLKTYTGIKRFVCSICGKGFFRNTNLKRHVQTHSQLRPFTCVICEKTFRLNSHLKEHKKTHTGFKPFSCETCGKSFTQSNSLKEHVRTHTGDKPFICDICGKAFTYRKSLKEHSKVHLIEKPYECHICGRKFTDNSNLRKHIDTHAGKLPYGRKHKLVNIVQNNPIVIQDS